MKFLLITLFFASIQSSSSPKPNSMLREFVRDAINTTLSNKELGDKYFCTNILHRTDSHGEEARSYLELAFSQQRGMLRAEHISPDELVLTPFDALPDKQVNLSDVAKDVYVAQFKEKILLYILIKDDKIASTLLLSKGGKSCFFINFCE